MGVNDKTIQAILRHSNIGLTMNLREECERVSGERDGCTRRKIGIVQQVFNGRQQNDSVMEGNCFDSNEKWSRGRDLNPRPADYELSAFALSRWFFVSVPLPLSPPFAPILLASLQRNLQRNVIQVYA